MKSLIVLGLAIALTPVVSSAQNDTQALLFSAELESFIDQATALYEGGDALTPDELKRGVDSLIEISSHIAAMYFDKIGSAEQKDYDVYLSDMISSHNEIRNYFVLLGNRFLFEANEALKARNNQIKKFKSWSVVGGTVLGLASGVALLAIRPQFAKSALSAGLVIVGLSAAGAGGGYAVGHYAQSYFLPADPNLKKAEDFIRRYPAGEDFIQSLEGIESADLSLGLREIALLGDAE